MVIVHGRNNCKGPIAQLGLIYGEILISHWVSCIAGGDRQMADFGTIKSKYYGFPVSFPIRSMDGIVTYYCNLPIKLLGKYTIHRC